MPVLDTSGYEFHEPPISWGRLTFGLGDDQVTLQIGKMLREAFDAGIKKSYRYVVLFCRVFRLDYHKLRHIT